MISGSRLSRGWRSFCRLTVRVFYRRLEVAGLKNIPQDSGILFCANHVNALADAVVMQAATNRAIRPLARSGLFENPFLKPVLNMIGAVPIFRRQDAGVDTSNNQDTFAACYELLAQHETLIIFPEGQSHSDPYLHELKTGAARIALGALENNDQAPAVIPVGLTFVRKGSFRGDVLVYFGEPVDLSVEDGVDHHAAVKTVTQRITSGLKEVTINADSWQDIELLGQVQRFFALRQGKYQQARLTDKFEALQRLIEGHKILLEYEPDKVRSLVLHLRMFERLCKCCGIDNYQLTVDYQPLMIALYITRTILIVVLGFPIALWGLINSYVPFQLTRYLSRLVAKGKDQYDTSKMVLGIGFFTLFWGLQTAYIYINHGLWWAIGYFISLVVSAPVVLKMKHEYRLAWDNIKTFFLFLRRRQLKEYMRNKQKEIVVELAHLVRVAKRLTHQERLAEK